MHFLVGGLLFVGAFNSCARWVFMCGGYGFCMFCSASSELREEDISPIVVGQLKLW